MRKWRNYRKNIFNN
ncbi:hypothetical protein BLA29_013480 [Euroglyphus maynei]|uniref:Uncharacterized protein n=1 Tax=Euroglyphus maynei TaxID=6958 RepID=A0A1Y3AX79_EURMA|nr:hypothetical protein BLA29_013480 [Euroglyphus maynei]